VSSATLQGWANALQWLRERPLLLTEDGVLQPEVVRFTSEGRGAFANFHDQLVAEMNGSDFPAEWRSAWMKLRSQGARLALAIHLLRRAEAATVGGGQLPHDVDMESMAVAHRLADYFRGMFRRVVSSATDDQAGQRAESVLRWLVAHGEPRITRFKASEFLQQRHGAWFRSVGDVVPALELLVRHNSLRTVPPASTQGLPGRPPKDTYEVNPAVYRDPSILRSEERDRKGA
jgi:hypothetical protein